ncbi:deoxycytidylate deaminase [Fusobacterium sp. MFO224]|uniref:deoxycytidylate deaminase n=1 Tax=Fusobacterium sp. MFO224 TaxID=3378070 RepID=UPI0038556101
MKRQDYISWDQYFMGIALLSAKRSKDPSTQVGACIVNPDKKIVGVGYNGLPQGCSDDEFSWKRDGEYLDTKYPFVCHAELNAILNSIKNLKNCIIYVGLFPCNECSKSIIQSGIKEIVFLSEKYKDSPSDIASKRMLDMAGVKYRKLKVEKKEIVLSFDEEKLESL